MKKFKLLCAVISFTILSTMPVYAGWEQTGATWKYQNTDKTYMTNSWAWLDGNNDGISECYYFGADGIMLSNVTTADGYLINANGQWVVNNVVQTKTTTEAPTVEQTQAPTQAPETEAQTEPPVQETQGNTSKYYKEDGTPDIDSIVEGLIAGDPDANAALNDVDTGSGSSGNFDWN